MQEHAKAAQCVEGVIGVLVSGGRLLAIKRSQHVPVPGHWCLPGGAIEANETPAEALVREVREEVGLHVRPVRQVWDWLREDGRLHLVWWLAEVLGDPEALDVDLAEVAEARWVGRSEFEALTPILPNNLLLLETCPGLLEECP